MTGRVQRDRTADAEVRPQQRAGQAGRDRAVDPDCQLDVVRDTRELGGARIGRSTSTSGTSAGVGRNDGVTETTRDREAGAVAAGLRKRLTAGREDDGDARRIGAARGA